MDWLVPLLGTFQVGNKAMLNEVPQRTEEDKNLQNLFECL